jgi:3-deoxy-D-manno-octulosonic-acid transferase
VIIAGSSWQKDEELLIESYISLKAKHANIKLIIAPHEIDHHNIERLKKLLSKHHIDFHLYSDNESNYMHSVLVINAIGFLSSVYQYGSVAFIGGGFDNGIHNILEPTVFGLPVLFGPNYKKFNEAFDVIKLKVGFVMLNSDELSKQLNIFAEDKTLLNETSLLAENYVRSHVGATQKIIVGLH